MKTPVLWKWIERRKSNQKKDTSKDRMREISSFYWANSIYKINDDGTIKNERLKIIGVISLG